MRVFLIILLVILVIVVIAIIFPIITGRSPSGRLSGETLFKSEDGGESWQNLDSFPGGEITDLALANDDQEFLWVGTERRGIWRGGKDGSEWSQFQGALGEGSKIFDILDKTALVFFQNRGRVISFENDNENELLFTPLERFAYLKGRKSGNIIQVIGSDGGFYESSNSGRSWQVLSRFRDGLLVLEVNRRSPSEIWTVDTRGEFFHSLNGGRAWENLSDSLREFSGAEGARVIFYESWSGILYHGSKHGLLESFDKGRSWRAVGLPIPQDALPVSAFAVDSQNSRRLFAAAQNQLFISLDRGLTWRALQIPASGTISSILIDPADTKKIFIGLKGRERIR